MTNGYYGVIGFLLGLIVMGLVNANSGSSQQQVRLSTDTHMMSDGTSMNNHEMNMNESMSMEGMVEALKGKTGDDFDREFLRLMIEHHQGAVDMAQEALKNAGHDEVKTMSKEIRSAQMREIEMMKQWQIDWGYTQ